MEALIFQKFTVELYNKKPTKGHKHYHHTGQ